MIRSLFSSTRKLMLVAAALGFSLGGAATLRATELAVAEPTWPNQCYNSDGSLSCPICGSKCLGGDYLCCNNGATLQ